MLALPFLDLSPPGRARGGVLRLELTCGFFERFVDALEDPLHVAHDGNIRRAILADLGGIDIHVDDFGVRRERGQAAGDAIVEADAERDQQVGLGHAHVGRVAAVHAGHADEVRMRAGQPAQPHQRADRRRIHQLHQRPQLFARIPPR